MRVLAAALIVVLGLGSKARADEPKPRQPYAIRIFKANVLPTKADGRVWDGTAVIKDLPDPKGLSPTAFAAAAGKKLVESGLDAIAAPDIYVIVEVTGPREGDRAPNINGCHGPSSSVMHEW